MKTRATDATFHGSETAPGGIPFVHPNYKKKNLHHFSAPFFHPQGGNKIGIFIFALIAMCLSIAIQAANTNRKDPVFYIIFANGFSGERVDVCLNNKKVISGARLASERSTGLTSAGITVFELNGAYYAKTYLGFFKVYSG